MQLSSKASPVVLKPFTNVHSPFWHSSFQHFDAHTPEVTGHQHWCDHDIKPGASSHSLLLGRGPSLPCVHFPIPSLLPSRAAAVPSTFQYRSAAALLRRSSLPASSFLLGRMSGQRSCSPGWQCWGRPGWGRELGSPKLEGCKSKGRCPSVTLQRSFWREAKSGWEEHLNQGKIFLFYTITHSPLPAPATTCPRSLTQSNAWHYPDTCF